MYSLSQIKEGIGNPQKLKDKFSRIYYNKYKYRAINKRVDNSDRNPNVGLVVNWGCHQVNHWPVAEYKYLVREFVESHDPLILPNQETYDRWKEEISDIVTIEPSSYMAPKISYDQAEDHTIALITGHPHSKTDEFAEYIAKNGIQHILSRYYHPMRFYFPSLAESKLVHFPWSVPEQYIIPAEEISFHNQDKITIFGKVSEHPMYETRSRCRESGFVSDVRSITTSKNDSKPLTDREYYNWIRSFDAVIAAGSFQPKYQYTFAKYFEIPAAGSLLFAQYCSDLERIGFTDENCMIFENMSEFQEKAETYLSAPEEYLTQRKKGVELIRERHTVAERIKTIEDICTSL